MRVALLAFLTAACIYMPISIAVQAHAAITSSAPREAQSVEGGMWRTDAAFDSRLHLKNVLLHQRLDATPTIIFADGTTYPLSTVHLEPASVRVLNINDALDHLPSEIAAHRSMFGMVSIAYSWSWSGALLASVQNTDEMAMLSFHSSLQSDTAVPKQSKQTNARQSLDVSWWRPFATTQMFLFIGNTNSFKQTFDLEAYTAGGQLLQTISLSLAPHASTQLDIFSLLPAKVDPGTSGSLSIHYSGASNSITAVAGLQDTSNGFSETLHGIERHPEEARDKTIHPVSIATPGVLFGLQKPTMLFPGGTSFVPYVLVHNASKTDRLLTLSATYSSGGKPSTLTLGSMNITPGATSLFDVDQAMAGRKLVPDDGSIQLEEQFVGNEDDLEIESGSVDQSGNYVFESEAHIESWTISRTLCYWSVFGDTNSMVSLWNYTNKPEDLVLTLYFSGGQYELPLHLDARASYDLDVASLVKHHVPDKYGSFIPSYVTEGSALLASAEGEFARLDIATSTSTFNVRTGTCSNQCGSCNGVSSASINPTSADVTVGQSVQFTGQLTYNTGSTQAVTGATWSSSNPAVATVSSTGFVTTSHWGYSEISYQTSTYPGALSYTCMGNSFQCPTSTYSAGAEIDVYTTSCPTSISVNHDDQESLSTIFPGRKTGVGIAAEMLASGPAVPYDGAHISEQVSRISNGCSAYITNNTCVATGNGFQVGQGGRRTDGLTDNPTTDIFYDEHALTSSTSTLPAGASCTNVCSQQYSCGGSNVGPVFTITQHLAAGTLSGTPVTFVTVTK